MINTLENVKATVSGTRRKDLMTKIRSSRCKSLTSKMLMEIDVSSDRESDFTASVLPVDKKKIEYRVRAVGVDASVTVKSWTLLDDSATLSRVQINRCHNLSSYLVETLLHVAVNSSSWVQITQCEFWSWIKVPRYDFATFAWPKTLQSCWKAWNQLIAISINFHHFFRIESKFRLSKQHFWKKKKKSDCMKLFARFANYCARRYTMKIRKKGPWDGPMGSNEACRDLNWEIQVDNPMNEKSKN